MLKHLSFERNQSSSAKLPNCSHGLTGVMAASEIPPQMANFQTFSLKDLFSCQGDFCTLPFCVKFQPFSPKSAHFGIKKHSGMIGISLAELALHNRCGLESENMQQKPYFCLSKWSPILDCKNGSKPHFFTPLILGDK